MGAEPVNQQSDPVPPPNVWSGSRKATPARPNDRQPPSPPPAATAAGPGPAMPTAPAPIPPAYRNVPPPGAPAPIAFSTPPARPAADRPFRPAPGSIPGPDPRRGTANYGHAASGVAANSDAAASGVAPYGVAASLGRFFRRHAALVWLVVMVLSLAVLLLSFEVWSKPVVVQLQSQAAHSSGMR